MQTLYEEKLEQQDLAIQKLRCSEKTGATVNLEIDSDFSLSSDEELEDTNCESWSPEQRPRQRTVPPLKLTETNLNRLNS
jgi:hypothetical protein